MSTAADRFIASCGSWDDFWDRAKKLSEAEKGSVFERLTQLYLTTAPEYPTKLQDVWLLRDIPVDVRRRLNLPGPRDEGIDLLARTRQGKYWAIQAKFRSQPDKPLSRTALSTFTSLAFHTCINISLAVVAHTATKPVGKRHLMPNTVEIGLDRWRSLDRKGWTLIVGRLKGRSARPRPRSPRPHQRDAISAAKRHFIAHKAARGRLIMPCGTGKSLAAFWIAKALRAKTVLVAVPSLALIRQSVTDWTREFLAHNQIPDWLCVCSDETVGNLERDEFVGERYDTGLPTHTDPKEIARRLRAPSKGSKIVFTTYQSSDKLAAAARRANIGFDLAILDEAHKTVGVRSKTFATLLRERKFKARRRLFMTATERVFRGDSDEVLSMDNEADYGKCFFQLSYKEAIAQRIISDYKILTMAVSDERVARVIKENRILNLRLRDLDEAEARAVATGVALKRVEKQGVTHAISFHSSIRAAERFRDQQDVLNKLRPRTTNLHISSKKTAGERADLLREFVGESRALMTNARCLTEGVDVPAIDCVVFADPKQSRVDIVQAAGRALRRYPGKDYGYILLPLVVPHEMGFYEFAETTAFRQVARIVTALSTQDERIADEFRAVLHGHISSGNIVEVSGDVPLGMHMSLGRFADAISTRIWESVGRANWRRFDDARAFTRNLGLNNRDDWFRRCQSGKIPPDIPSYPQDVYEGSGWVDWGDWLGTGRVYRPDWLPFNEARRFVHRLDLKSEHEWRDYVKSGKKPKNIPAKPDRIYSSKKIFRPSRGRARDVEAGWIGWGDWLGTRNRRPGQGWQPFKQARAYARSLHLKSSTDWRQFAASKKRPADIPADPNTAYAKEGWRGMSDWLGTQRKPPGNPWRPFKQARAYVRSLHLKSSNDWPKFLASKQRPSDIPTNPHLAYANQGWRGMSDWLGTQRKPPDMPWRSFESARAFVRSLHLKSEDEWHEFKHSGNRPIDIPAKPDHQYAGRGWAGYRDWLGVGEFRSFKQARAFVRGLRLKSKVEWFNYCRSGKKPHDIPTTPYIVYAKTGWAGWGDWLGTGRRPPGTDFRPFEKARAYARSLNLKNAKGWFAYCQSGKKPDDIPTQPGRVYADAGWDGFGDWLGTGRRRALLRQGSGLRAKSRAQNSSGLVRLLPLG
jgi:superfamily II DNA or RNA helicase